MSLESLIQTLGLPGLTLGAALEGEAVAFLGGVLAHKKVYSFEAAALAISLGAAFVDNAIFLIGRRAKENAFVQRNLGRETAQRFYRLLDRNMTFAVVGFRFLYGLKTVGALTMGTTGIRWARFAALDLVGVLIWAHLVVGLGYAAGSAVTAMFGHLRLHWHLLACFGIFLGVAAVFWWMRKRRTRSV
ncbi:DedA family protein [Phaeobacter marinintestinus]|uniref:DedA family protein n=1 Tax=Falsiphaeobacter marinintestinus TaxID=1492905 RepID=UPI0011B576B5|nr:DedA family protein [Phaeobacter marinintestinus]